MYKLLPEEIERRREHCRKLGATGLSVKARQLKPEDIPEEYRDRVKLCTKLIKLGTKHHKEWYSTIICIKCGHPYDLKNSRLKEKIKENTFFCKCGHCSSNRCGITYDPKRILK